MSKSCLIIHDSYSSPAEPWIVELAAQLRARGYATYTPVFPTPVGQDYPRWLGIIEPYRAYLNTDSVLVGVGVGATMVLRVLQQSKTAVAQTILLAPFADRLPNDNDNLLVTSFIAEPFDWQTIQKNAGQVSVLVSADDPVVPVALSQSVVQKLNGKIQVFSGRGHFRQSNGVASILELPGIIDAGGLHGSVSVPETVNVERTPVGDIDQSVENQTEQVSVQTQPAYEAPTHARTLRTDFSSALAGASTREMAHILGEYRAEHERVVVGKYVRIRKAILMSLGILCLIGGLAAIGWMIKAKIAQPIIVPVQELPLRANSVAEVSFSPIDRVVDIQSRARDSLMDISGTENALHIIRFQQSDATPPSAQTFFKAIEPDIPTTFTKTLQSPFVFGYVFSQSQWRPFALFAVDNFTRASGSIGDWDELLSSSLTKLFAPQYSFALGNSLYSAEFQSRTQSNRDVTVFVLKPEVTATVQTDVIVDTPDTLSSDTSGVLIDDTTEQSDLIGSETNTITPASDSGNTIIFLTPAELKSLTVSMTTITAATVPERLAKVSVGDVLVIPATVGHLAADDMRSVINITTESDKTVFSTVIANPLSVFALLSGTDNTVSKEKTSEVPEITAPVDVFGYTFINDSYLLFVSDVNTIPVLTDRLLQKL